MTKFDEIKRQATFITNIPGLGYTEKQYRDSLTLLLKALELAGFRPIEIGCPVCENHARQYATPEYWLELAEGSNEEDWCLQKAQESYDKKE